ncbi:MAG: hypothetical protein E2O54_12775 [Gammaproteobacteria bacterium]|nr:MAG: hypothetical protein E2O54_12775 [Gammaproteobacteria bacterium]
MRALVVSLVVLVGLTGPALGWGQFPESERTGIVQVVELDSSSLIISGTRYRVALDAHVEINGTYGAYSMLSPGTKVRFICLVVSGEEREIVEIQTLPSSTVIEET